MSRNLLIVSVEHAIKIEYLEIRAGVRYWEDARINGIEDIDGSLVPMRKDNSWVPKIRLSDGQIMDWPDGTAADIHYKVCDDGDYWLLDAGMKRVAKKTGYYVPDDIICPKTESYGDYIILKIREDGHIVGWENPDIDSQEWQTI